MTKATAFLISVLFTLNAGCAVSEDCKVKTCGKDIGSGFSTNNKAYEKCFSGSSTSITTTLVGDDGAVFFECTDSPGKSCTESSVNAQFAYCDIR